MNHRLPCCCLVPSLFSWIMIIYHEFDDVTFASARRFENVSLSTQGRLNDRSLFSFHYILARDDKWHWSYQKILYRKRTITSLSPCDRYHTTIDTILELWICRLFRLYGSALSCCWRTAIGLVWFFQFPHGSLRARAEGLIACFGKFFARFRISEVISSDSSPEFVPKATKNFLFCYEVHQDCHWCTTHS